MHASEFGQEGRGVCVTACREEPSGDRASPLQEDVGVGKDPKSESTVPLIQSFSSDTAVSPKIPHYKRVLNPFSQHSRTPARLDYVPHNWGAQRVYWGVLRPRICTQRVKSMLGWRGLHWPLTSPWKRRLQVAPSVLVLSPPTAVGFGGIPHHVASQDR